MENQQTEMIDEITLPTTEQLVQDVKTFMPWINDEEAKRMVDENNFSVVERAVQLTVENPTKYSGTIQASANRINGKRKREEKQEIKSKEIKIKSGRTDELIKMELAWDDGQEKLKALLK